MMINRVKKGKLFDYLLKHADLNVTDCCGWTAFHHIFHVLHKRPDEFDIEVLEKLLKRRANLNIAEFKAKHKTLYWILIPFIGIVLLITAGAKILMELNVIGGKKSIKKAELKDSDLKAEQDEAERKAKEMKAEADLHGEKDKDSEKKADEVEVDEDWHLKD